MTAGRPALMDPTTGLFAVRPARYLTNVILNVRASAACRARTK